MRPVLHYRGGSLGIARLPELVRSSASPRGYLFTRPPDATWSRDCSKAQVRTRCLSIIMGGRRMVWRVGVDSGGTFTDVCLFEEMTGRLEVWKVSSTPDDPSRGIAQGVKEGVGRVEAVPQEVVYFGHGTTVATNALIQHRGVPTGLITTAGFRDLLEIGRQKRPDLYDLQADKPYVLVSRDLRLEVPERLRHDGTVETELDEEIGR